METSGKDKLHSFRVCFTSFFVISKGISLLARITESAVLTTPSSQTPFSLRSQSTNRLKFTLETSGEDVKTTLERSGEDVKTTLRTSGEDVKTTLRTSGEDVKTTLETSQLSPQQLRPQPHHFAHHILQIAPPSIFRTLNLELHSKRVEKMKKYTRNEWGRCKSHPNCLIKGQER